MDKLLRRMEQDRKRNKDEFEKMKRHVYIMSCVGIGFLILVSISCFALIAFSLTFLYE